MARMYMVPDGCVNEVSTSYEYMTPFGMLNETAAAAVGAFLARLGPVILQAVNRASTY